MVSGVGGAEDGGVAEEAGGVGAVGGLAGGLGGCLHAGMLVFLTFSAQN